MLGLSWADVDTQGRTIRVERQLDREGRRVEVKTRGSNRTVAITPDLATRLAEHRLAQGRPEGGALVFTRADGRHWSRSAADRALAIALRDAGLPAGVTWHDLRHGHVSRLFAAGVDAVTIAARIGDTIATVLNTYAHEYDSARRRDDESARMAALYDDARHGSFMEARGNNAAQQSATDIARNSALDRGIRSVTQ